MEKNGIDSNSARYKFNRLMGLSAYAMGVLMVLPTAMLTFEAARGAKADYSLLGIFAGATVILFAIGYTTGRRGKSD